MPRLTETPLRFSLRVNNDLRLDQLIELAEVAEQLDFDQLWVSNDLFLRSAPVVLAVLAERTERIRLGTGVLNPYTVHPAEIAMLAMTLQEASNGRFLLGIAAGAADFLSWIGIEQVHPLRRVEQAVAVVRRLLTGDHAFCRDSAGEPSWSSDAYLRIPSVATPIYLGAMSPKMLTLAGQIGDGVLALCYPPERYLEMRAPIERGIATAERRIDDIDLPLCLWCSVDGDEERATLALAEKLAYYGPATSPALLRPSGLSPEDFLPLRAALDEGRSGDLLRECTESMRSLGLTGSTAAIIDRCRALLELGARHLSFGPPLGPDPVAAARLLGSEVVPALRSSNNEGS